MMKDLTPFAKALWIDLAKQKDPWDPWAKDLQTCFSFISCNDKWYKKCYRHNKSCNKDFIQGYDSNSIFTIDQLEMDQPLPKRGNTK